MTRKLAFLAAAVAAAAVASSALGAVDADLKGAFKAHLTIETSTNPDQPPGTEVNRTFKFKCLDDPCSTVKFTRQGAVKNFKSTLTEGDPGVYDGPEGPTDVQCSGDPNDNGTLSADQHVEVTKANSNGKATKAAGEMDISTAGCDNDFTQHAVWTGKLK